MGVANPVVNCLVMIRLYADRFGNAFSHELASCRRANDVNFDIHRCSHCRMVKWRRKLLRIARIGVHENDQQFLFHFLATLTAPNRMISARLDQGNFLNLLIKQHPERLPIRGLVPRLEPRKLIGDIRC